MKNKYITRIFRENFLKVFVIFLVINLLVLGLVPIKNLKSASVYVFIVFFSIEFVIRLLLWIENGKSHKYSLFFFSLVRDKIYGYRFKKSISTKGLTSEISDKFLQKWKFEYHEIKNQDSTKFIEFTTDQFGFRKGIKKDIGENEGLRIFCCGGSTTSCDGVGDLDTWPSVLETNLKKSGFNVSVTNAGVPGWHSYQDLLLIKNEIIKLNPDVILLHQGWNEEFEYSGLNLGKWWKKNTVRNELESNFLYTPKNRLLSQKFSLFFLLLIRGISWNIVFKRKMSFKNVGRWRCLLSHKYLESWYLNIEEIASLCEKNNILLFTLDYPALVSVGDSEIERHFFLQHPNFANRITPDFADYQAISKLGIGYFLKDISDLVPNLDASKFVNQMDSEQRASQFGDEIHFSTAGCKNFGNYVAQLISINPDFVSRYNGNTGISNISTESKYEKKTIQGIIESRDFIHRLIQKKINKLESDDSKGTSLVNSERYTTF
jgi:hypothetical protein